MRPRPNHSNPFIILILRAYCQAFHISQSRETFNFEELEKDLNAAGWTTSHLQVMNQGWNVDISDQTHP